MVELEENEVSQYIESSRKKIKRYSKRCLIQQLRKLHLTLLLCYLIVLLVVAPHRGFGVVV
jgi:cell division septal protein FtsQ